MIIQVNRQKKYAKLKLSGLDQAPEQLAVFADITTKLGHGLGKKTMPETIEYSVVGAINNMWLTARAQGGWFGLGVNPGTQKHQFHS